MKKKKRFLHLKYIFFLYLIDRNIGEDNNNSNDVTLIQVSQGIIQSLLVRVGWIDSRYEDNNESIVKYQKYKA